MMRNMHRRRGLGLALAAVLVLAACGGEEEAAPPPPPSDPPPAAEAAPEPEEPEVEPLEDRALAEGQLVVYTSGLEATWQDVVDGFMAAYPGITVELLRLGTGQMSTRFLQEQENGIYVADIMAVANRPLYEDNEDLFVNLIADDDVRDAVERWAPEHRGDWFFNTTSSENALGYNTDLVSEDDLPETWMDLTDPRWSGQIIMNDPRASPTYSGFMNVMRQDVGDDFLTGLAQQDITYVDSAATMAQEVASGAYLFAIGITFGNMAQVIESGAPIAWYRPDGARAPANQHFFGIAQTAPNPNAARLFLNWFTTAEGQALLCQGVTSTPTPDDVPECLELAERHISADEVQPTDEEMSEILNLMGIPE